LKTQTTLSQLLFPNAYRRKVLGLLLMQPQRSVHLRELARLTHAAPGTLKKEVDALCAVGLLNSHRVGNQLQVQANSQHPVFPELQALVRKTVGVADVLKEALAPVSAHIQHAFVFGSVASGQEHAHSDVDLMVVGDVSFAAVVDATFAAQALLGRDINPKVMSAAEWHDKQAQGHPFVSEVLSNPTIDVIGTAVAA
jgi:predicted nucleotidyltransferase